MTPRNLLRALIATIGFIGAGYGVLYVLDALLYSLGLDQTTSSAYHTKYYAIRGLAEILISYWIMHNADRLAAITFPDEGEEEPAEEEEEVVGGARR
jgi:hypothetical protein